MVFGGECSVLAHRDDKVGFNCSVSVEGRHTGLGALGGALYSVCGERLAVQITANTGPPVPGLSVRKYLCFIIYFFAIFSI